MPEPPRAHIAHALPGRTRLRLPALRGDLPTLSSLALDIARLRGVASAHASGPTASVLVHHDGPIDSLLAAVAEAGLFTIAEAPAPPRSFALPDTALLHAAGAAVAAGLALVQIIRRDPLPPALTLGMHAVELARKAMRHARAGDTPDPPFAAGDAG